MKSYMTLKGYHISHSKNRESIVQHGLIPHAKTEGRIQYEPRIFFSVDKNDLGFDFVNYENVDCWEFEIELNSAHPDSFSGSSNHFYIKENIPASKISLVNFY